MYQRILYRTLLYAKHAYIFRKLVLGGRYLQGTINRVYVLQDLRRGVEQKADTDGEGGSKSRSKPSPTGKLLALLDLIKKYNSRCGRL